MPVGSALGQPTAVSFDSDESETHSSDIGQIRDSLLERLDCFSLSWRRFYLKLLRRYWRH